MIYVFYCPCGHTNPQDTCFLFRTLRHLWTPLLRRNHTILEGSQVVEVMPCHDLHNRTHRLFSTLRMRIPLPPISFTKRSHERHIPSSQRLEGRPRGVQRIRVIHLRPSVLLERLNRGMLFAQRLSQPPGPHHLAVREVRNNLPHAPLPRSRTRLNLRRAQPIQNQSQSHRRLRNRLRCIAPFQHPCIRNSAHP